jgi:hypothetical protein
VQNRNITEEVRAAKIDKMDWELFQMHQPFTSELLEKYMDEVEPIYMFRYQSLNKEDIWKLMYPAFRDEKYALFKGYLDLVFEYQKVPEQFIVKMLAIETEISAKIVPENKEHILIDMDLLVKKQELSEEFMSTFFADKPASLMNVFTYQKMSSKFAMKLLEKNSYNVHMIKCVLTFQKLDTDDLMLLLDNPNLKEEYLTAIEYQEYDDKTLTLIKERIPKELLDVVNNIVFLRCITGRLKVDCTLSTHRQIMESVNWKLLSKKVLSDLELETLLDPKYSKNLCWYSLLQNNLLSEDKIIEETEAGNIGCIQWWAVLSTCRPKGKEFTEEFLEKYGKRKKWWNMLSDHSAVFYKECMSAIISESNKDNELLQFLRDFVKLTDWHDLLSKENLPEWFLRLFQNFSSDIPLFWGKVCRLQTLSEGFIADYMDRLDIDIILTYQALSENHLENLQEVFCDDHWDKVARYQPLSDRFIKKYSDKLNPSILRHNKYMSEKSK